MSFFHRLFKLRIFKFRTTLSEELDDLHTESIHLQQTLTQTRLLQRQWTKWFAIYALIAYVALNIVYFTLFLPKDYLIRTYAFMISAAMGALLYGIHWLTCWYFRTMIHMKEDRIVLFKDRKQELIEEVKTKETYAVAKALLEKYGETITPEARPSTTTNDARPRVSVRPTLPDSERPAVSVTPSNIGTLTTSNQPMPTTVLGGSNRPSVTTPSKLPRAILPPQRTFWGTILDVIVGDGPSKRLICDERLHERWKFRFRYALICRSCNSHNGMALEEEFEYLSFRCAYCNYFNSARKQKPVFHGDIVAHDQQQPTTTNSSTVESMDVSDTAADHESREAAESNVIHRSIRLAASHIDESAESTDRRQEEASSSKDD